MKEDEEEIIEDVNAEAATSEENSNAENTENSTNNNTQTEE